MSSRVINSNQSPADYLKAKFHPKLMEGKKNYRKALETLRDTYSKLQELIVFSGEEYDWRDT